MINSRQLTGDQGEELASQYLRDKGYQIIDRNYRCKFGELDIIARINEYLVFCEVKTKRGQTVHPTYSITTKKIKKLHQLGLYYISRQRLHQYQPRFDVIAIQILNNRAPIIEHFINAL